MNTHALHDPLCGQLLSPMTMAVAMSARAVIAVALRQRDFPLAAEFRAQRLATPRFAAFLSCSFSRIGLRVRVRALADGRLGIMREADAAAA